MEERKMLVVFLKAEQLGLFQQVVPVKGHMRGEHFVAPYTAGRKKRRAVAQAKEPEPAAARELSGDALIQAAIAELESRFSLNGPIFTDPNSVKDFLRLKIGGLEHEQFSVMFLTNKHQLIAYDELFRGTINAANVYPREVVKAALKHNAAAVVLAHNHPSGNAEPSVADVSLTDRLKSALGLVDIKVLDHMIATPSGIYSFAEKGGYLMRYRLTEERMDTNAPPDEVAPPYQAKPAAPTIMILLRKALTGGKLSPSTRDVPKGGGR